MGPSAGKIEQHYGGGRAYRTGRRLVKFGKWQGRALGPGMWCGAAVVGMVWVGGYRVGFCKFRMHAVGAGVKGVVRH